MPVPASGLQPPAYGLAAKRPRLGLSLLEVLISMFVMFVGLMGVAAMIPAGRFEILQGSKVDHATMVGRAAIAEMKIRGFLNPSNWQDFGGTSLYNAATPTNLASVVVGGAATQIPCVCVDPLALSLTPYPALFPATVAGGSTNPKLTRIFPGAQANSGVSADGVFRDGDDLVFDLTKAGKNQPPPQQMMAGGAKRGSRGDYSWLATIVPPVGSTIFNNRVTVSVAVCYKREINPTSPAEQARDVTALAGTTVTCKTFPKPLKPGHWIMLASPITVTVPDPTSPPATRNETLNYAAWYKVVAADVPNGVTQTITVNGEDWSQPATNTFVWWVDGVISVHTRNLRLEVP